MSDAQPQVVVRGRAVLTVAPEIADLQVSAHAWAGDRQTALDRCAARQAQVARVVAAAGRAVESVETTGISVSLGWRDREHEAEPYASVQTRVRLGDLDAVGDLVAGLGALDGVSVDGPSWGLRPASPAFERARLAAVEDAVHRARTYAAAFGARLTALLEVADDGLSGTGPEPLRAEMLGVAAEDGAGGRPSGPALTPGRQEVHGAVEIRFAMSAPDPTVFAG